MLYDTSNRMYKTIIELFCVVEFFTKILYLSSPFEKYLSYAKKYMLTAIINF